MAIALALTAAVAWGWSDFIGGATSRREHHVTVALWSQLLGFVPFLPVALLVAPIGALTGRDAVLGAVAGVGGTLGLVMLFRGLAVGRMAVVAPITALGAAGLPVLWGVVVDRETPGPLGWVGLVAALGAIWLVSSSGGDDRHRVAVRGTGVIEAVASSVGFAIVYIALDGTGEASGLWPLLPTRVVVVTLIALLGLAQGAPRMPSTQDHWRPLAAIAVLDTVAIAAYLLATKQGLLAIVAVLASLYPAGTVLLARWRLGEQLTPTQLGGLGLAGGAVALIALG